MLRDDWKEPQELAPTRDGFGEGLLALGDADPRVVALCADLAESTRMLAFREKYPERYIEIGVAEQNLAGIASGLAAVGKIPFIASYATFSPGRNNEQIRTALSINQRHVIIVGSHAGVSVGPDGATHQALEDIALMRVQPHMTVLSPCDADEAKRATIAAAALEGPVYLRLAREKTPRFSAPDAPFTIGKANVLHRSDAAPQVAFVATGPVAHNALLAAAALEADGIGSIVINMHTVKPLDDALVLASAKEAGAVVTVEEHQVAGGLGGAVAELLARELPTPIEFIGVHDQFGQSGTPGELIAHYGMDAPAIIRAAKKAIERKRL